MADSGRLGSLGRRRRFALATAVVWVVGLLAFAASSRGQSYRDAELGSYLIRVGPKFQRLGDFRISSNPTYAGAIDALGEASECRLIRSPSHAVAIWRSHGVRIDLWTYGLIPEGKDGCSAPEAIRINSIRVTSKRWVTSLGLRVGDTKARLRRLYPRAARDPRGGWPRPNSYWLVSRRTVCFGDCATRYVSVPQLLAEIRQGRVAAFFFHVGAQGE